MIRLQSLLGVGPSLDVNQRDSIRWKAEQSGTFKVGFVYNWCQNRAGPALGNSELVWNNFAPPKAKFISWLAWRGRLKTSDFLSRVGVLRGPMNLCCVLCKAEEETCNHLLLSCSFGWRVWSNIMAWWEIQWVSPGSFEGLMYCWLGWRLKKKSGHVVQKLQFGVLLLHPRDCVKYKMGETYVLSSEEALLLPPLLMFSATDVEFGGAQGAKYGVVAGISGLELN
ncbi:hypothetical protein ACSBR1_009277 [Camellia fascicularis]